MDNTIKFDQNLPNKDLRDKFMAKTEVQTYFKTFFKLEWMHFPQHESAYKGIFQIIKPDIEELFSRFGISLQLPSQQYIQDSCSFKMDLKPASQNNLDRYSPLFFLEWSIYPAELIKKLQLKSVYFIEDLNFITNDLNQYRAAVPDYCKSMSMYYVVKEPSIAYNKTVIHHELFHYIDYMHDYKLDNMDFESYNTSDFKYGTGGAYNRELKGLDPNVKGFLNYYSTTGVCEDVAEVYAYCMKDTDLLKNQADPIIQKKIDWIKKFCVDYFELKNDYWSELESFRFKISHLSEK